MVSLWLNLLSFPVLGQQQQLPVPKQPAAIKQQQTLSPPPNDEGEQVETIPAPTDDVQEEQTIDPDTPAGEEQPAPIDKPNNPLKIKSNELDELIGQQFTEDIWKNVISPLPCLDTSLSCVKVLQEKAVAVSPILKEMDQRVQQIEDKIEQAKKSNQTSINLAVFEPALQFFLRQDTVTEASPNGQSTQRKVGFIERVASLFTRPVPLLNELLSVIGIPLLRGTSGGNEQQRAAAIAVSDLQVKLAQLQADRAKLADTIRERVHLEIIDFDSQAREFQISQAIAQREVQRLSYLQVGYRFGNSDTSSYLSAQSSLDKQKAATLRSWAAMRGKLERIKLLAIGSENR